jgi:hypothetical protein
MREFTKLKRCTIGFLENRTKGPKVKSQGWAEFFSQSTTFRANGTLHHIVRTCVDPNFDNFDGMMVSSQQSAVACDFEGFF